eukprot:7010536-Alexandrium_andersonii.AAC.1
MAESPCGQGPTISTKARWDPHQSHPQTGAVLWAMMLFTQQLEALRGGAPSRSVETLLLSKAATLGTWGL